MVAIPTGGGKTFIICKLIDKLLSYDPTWNILVLSHVEEILEQDYGSISSYYDGINIGLYSAGLKSKTIQKITIAGIQSAYRKPDLFKQFNFVIIDEAHLITIKTNGMYRKFLGELNGANYIGLTATPFRLGHGYIHEGEGALFTKLVYDLTSTENFNRLVSDGYISKIICKGTELRFDSEDIKTVAGDFVNKQLSDKFDRESITNKAVNEIIRYGKNYKKWLVFAIDIKHAEHISGKLSENGIATICVHSKMETDRKRAIKDIKNGKYRAVITVNVLTIGLDVPDIDLIAMLRPTQSPIVYVQSVGRGMRIASGKDHCLVLDFADNVARLGPINNVIVKKRGDKKRKGEPITKECPECGVIYAISVKVCDICGHKFKFKEKISPNAKNACIVQEEKNSTKWIDVKSVTYSIHSKKGSPSSLRVTYKVGLNSFSEWICYDHKGFPGYKANGWVKFRLPKGIAMPKDVTELYKISDLLSKPRRILIDTSTKYPEIKDYCDFYYDFSLDKV